MAFGRASIFAAVLLAACVCTTMALRCYSGAQSNMVQQDCTSGLDRCLRVTPNGGSSVYSCATQALCDAAVTTNSAMKCCNTNLCNGASSLATMSVLTVSVAALAVKYFL